MFLSNKLRTKIIKNSKRVRNQKTPNFKDFWGFFPKTRFFSEKSSSVSFLTLKLPDIMCNFWKILWALFEKKKFIHLLTHLMTDFLTHQHKHKSNKTLFEIRKVKYMQKYFLLVICTELSFLEYVNKLVCLSSYIILIKHYCWHDFWHFTTTTINTKPWKNIVFTWKILV